MALDGIIHRQRPSWFQEFQQAPYTTLARSLYAQRQRLLSAPLTKGNGLPKTTVVCISDTHNSQPTLPPGDILIHAGDLTQSGTAGELQAQLDWLNAQPHQHKVVIAGNHDLVLDKQKSNELDKSNVGESLRWGSLIYLEHSSATLNASKGRKLKTFGHPSTRKHGNWAFQYERGVDVFTNRIDSDVDILITHGAPSFHLDVAGWGDENLMRELWRVRPRLHVFGHIHGGYGLDYLLYDRFEELYERVCSGRAGLLALLYMLLLLIRMWATGQGAQSQKTILVNASAVGGLLDEKKREAHIVAL